MYFSLKDSMSCFLLDLNYILVGDSSSFFFRRSFGLIVFHKDLLKLRSPRDFQWYRCYLDFGSTMGMMNSHNLIELEFRGCIIKMSFLSVIKGPHF